MKQKDIALIIIVVFISGVISFFISHLLFGGPKNRQQQVEVVDAISTQFNVPSDKYFNKNSIDPTQLIQIGQNTNPAPFDSH